VSVLQVFLLIVPWFAHTLQVLVDVEQTLGPIPPQQQQAFDAVSEVYGSTRTILACLDKQLLDKVSAHAVCNTQLF
jgi:hypothetical protein